MKSIKPIYLFIAKGFLSFLTFFCFFVLPAFSDNLLVNPGFELGTLEGWTSKCDLPWVWNLKCQYWIDSDIKASGLYSVRTAVSGKSSGGAQNSYFYQDFTLDDDVDSLTLAWSHITTNGLKGSRLTVRFRVDLLQGKKIIHNLYNTKKKDPVWSYQRHTVKDLKAGVYRLRFHLQSINEDGGHVGAARLWIDDVFVQDEPECLDIGLRVYNGEEKVSICCEPQGTITSPLRIAKNGIKYGIVLIDKDDPATSKVRVNTSLGVKALKKYPDPIPAN